MEILVYTKQKKCPVCQETFDYQAVRESVLRMIDTDSDLKVNYEPVDPIYYDVLICHYCGYARLQSRWDDLRGVGKQQIKDRITPKFLPKTYGEIYSAADAIHRYKLAIITKQAMEAIDSELAFLSLRIAWIMRDIQDEEEIFFIRHARDEFLVAYQEENLPIFNMDLETASYLIGELSRRLDDRDLAMQMFGRVLSTKELNPRLKDRTQVAVQKIRDTSK